MSSKGFLGGVAAALLLVGLVGAVVTWTIDVSALNHPGPLDSPLALVSRNSIRRHASDEKNPFSGDPAAAANGLLHFRDNCLPCHGAPSVEPNEFAKGLHPPAPDLASRNTQSFSDAELHWVVSRGVMMTGMPGFGETHTKAEVWHIVTFLRRLPDLTPEERRALTQPGETTGMAEHDAEHDGESGGMMMADGATDHDGRKEMANMNMARSHAGKPAGDEIKRLAGATGRLAQSPIAGRVAILELADGAVFVTVTEIGGAVPTDITNPELTLIMNGKTQSVKLEGKNGKYRGKRVAKVPTGATLRVFLDGKKESTSFLLEPGASALD